MTDWDSERLDASAELMLAGIPNHDQEARWLEEHVRRCGLSERVYRELVQRRVAGEPLQYVMGSSQFYDVELEVGPGVLIPRPETEVLVELAENLYPGEGRICDLCTGSGAIALSLAKLFPQAEVTATDLSPEALAYATRNRERLGLDNVTLLQGDLFEPLEKGSAFVLLTANPPYVSPEAYETLEPVVKDYEPALALRAEEDGLALIRRICTGAGEFLEDEGWLLMEIGDDQGSRVSGMLLGAGFRNIQIHRDYTGRERIAVAQK